MPVIPVLPGDRILEQYRAGFPDAQRRHAYLNAKQHASFAIDTPTRERIARLRAAGKETNADAVEQRFWETKVGMVEEGGRGRAEMLVDLND